MLYEELLDEAYTHYQIYTYEKPLSSRIKGLYADGVIWINKFLPYLDKGCAIAEELGHHNTSVGDILDQHDVINRRQELRARQWGHGRVIPLYRFVDAHKAKISGRYDLANYLGVTEEFLQETVDRYRDKYGLYKVVDDRYIVLFDPIDVMEVI